ncbi:unnamed protein product [Protopolystoma xenopodis]|uniref:Uncharacterized protein n=1 Tax=Protopolystoma xenopodis TaxID=117903 RepID=A0A3S5C138_9PLAT|nr:unnamed protein product [Protopolystoma xenopodis]
MALTHVPARRYARFLVQFHEMYADRLHPLPEAGSLPSVIW